LTLSGVGSLTDLIAESKWGFQPLKKYQKKFRIKFARWKPGKNIEGGGQPITLEAKPGRASTTKYICSARLTL